MPGMKGVNADGITDRLMDWSEAGMSNPDITPDLTDPATLGCVMALYEETRETLCCPDPVYTMAAAWGLMHPRTIEALIAALEAKP
jgi:hypothetical protein